MTDERWQAFKAAIPTKRYTALSAIKDKCIECKGGEGETKPCEVKTCPLYCFLRQRNREKENRPKRVLTDAQRANLFKSTEKIPCPSAQNQNKEVGKSDK